MISYYSSLKLWILLINSIEVIMRSSRWRRSAKIFEYVFNFSKVANLNSFAGIFWLVLAHLQNRFFVEHLPVAAYVRCLKEKEWKKWNSVFLLHSVCHFSLWHCKVQSGKEEQIKNISASKMKKYLEQPASNKIYWFL